MSGCARFVLSTPSPCALTEGWSFRDSVGITTFCGCGRFVLLYGDLGRLPDSSLAQNFMPKGTGITFDA